MNKKKKCVNIFVKLNGLSDYEVKSLKEKFNSFAATLAIVFDLDGLTVSEIEEFIK